METDMQQIVGRIGQSLAESVAMLRNQIEMRRQYSLVLLFTAGRSKDANAHYVFGNLRAWGWITLIIAVLQLAAAGGVLAGNQLARWFAVAVVGLSAIDMMFFVPAYPFWALTIIAVDVVALYGLCAYGSRANMDLAA